MKNLVLNTLHAVGVTSFLRRSKTNQLTVLSLHRISNERNTFWNPIKPSTFNELLVYVKKHYQVIGFEELASIKQPKKPLLILSFDDGYYDFYEHALPVLVKHDLPCNHNIVNECADKNMTIWTERLNVLFEHALHNNIPLRLDFNTKTSSLNEFNANWMAFYLDSFKTLLDVSVSERMQIIESMEKQLGIDSNRRMMNWDEIRECTSNKVEIGSHTYSHDSIGTISDVNTLNKEINTSKTEIESKLGKKISVFALPNGQTGTKADGVISNSDYKFVLYANDALNSMPLEKSDSPTKINRINLVDEPFPQMALRMEMFHQKLRKYV